VSGPPTRSVPPTAGTWLWTVTAQHTQDGPATRTWGVRVAETGQWVGQVNALGTGRANQAEAYANGGLFAASKGMADLLDEATRAWVLQLDAPCHGCTVPAADLLEWFTAWRRKARQVLDAAGVP